MGSKLHHCNLGMDKYIQPTIYQACDYLSMFVKGTPDTMICNVVMPKISHKSFQHFECEKLNKLTDLIQYYLVIHHYERHMGTCIFNPWWIVPEEQWNRTFEYYIWNDMRDKITYEIYSNKHWLITKFIFKIAMRTTWKSAYVYLFSVF